VAGVVAAGAVVSEVAGVVVSEAGAVSGLTGVSVSVPVWVDSPAGFFWTPPSFNFCLLLSSGSVFCSSLFLFLSCVASSKSMTIGPSLAGTSASFFVSASFFFRSSSARASSSFFNFSSFSFFSLSLRSFSLRSRSSFSFLSFSFFFFFPFAHLFGVMAHRLVNLVPKVTNKYVMQVFSK